MGRILLWLFLYHCVTLLWGQFTASDPSTFSTFSPTGTTVAVPPNVDSVSVKSRNETALTLEWSKVNNNNGYTYRLNYNEINISISGSEGDSVVTQIVSSLTPGTKYNFTLFTVFAGVESIGHNFTAVTTPFNVDDVSVKSRNETALTLEWNKINNNDYTYRLNYNEININISGLEGDSVVTHTVSPLTPGTKYNFTLYTVFDEVESSGHNFTEVTTPSNVHSVTVKSRNETALTLEWNKVNNNDYRYILNYNEINISISGLEGDSVVTHTVSPLTPGTKYNFTLYTVFETEKSSGHTFNEVTTPSDVDSVSVKSRNETALTLEWSKENNNNYYSYRLNYNGINININISEGDSVVTNTISSLLPGTTYSFTLYTVFEGVESRGYTFSTVTTPSNVDSVSVKSRSETAFTLQWMKVNNKDSNYRLIYNGINNSISGLEGDSAVTHTVSSLTPGTKYSFILFTVFKGVESSGYTFISVTTPSNVDSVSVKSRSETAFTLQWKKVNNNNGYTYRLNYNGINTNISRSQENDVVTLMVLSLSPGTKYTFTMYTVFEGVESSGHTFTEVTIPAAVTDLRCDYALGGYGLILVWGPPIGERVSVLVNMKGKSYNESGQELSIEGLQPAQWYTLTVTSLSGGIQSDPASITCQTDPRGVIAGVLVFLLLAIIILCTGIYIWRHKPGLSKVFRKSEPPVGTKLFTDKYKPIPRNKFPDHFNFMSCDENRGFSEEYEDLSVVGTDQSCIAALLPENKIKNRFTNVLPYDSSRVQLTEQKGAGSDYINANFMPGYGSDNKKFIAAQGPLGSTINDFWRMVWEQKSEAIIMLTNCMEGGRVKCEQYWPLDCTPCTYGSLLVTIQSEQKEKSWTLRQFVVRNKATSEERTVTHFHFTAWPDHGVPKGTDELILFREIVRQHIDHFQMTGPIVIHCSAGVGRTGTLIALDTLLQQLVNEEAVSIAACVHRLRLSRPLMVQTESQYVFLHQCIMDSLQPKEDFNQESIYENSDMMYVNAMALQQYRAANTEV